MKKVKHKVMHLIITIFVALLLWHLWGFFSSNVEQAKYEVIRTTKNYEIRKYTEQVVAETTLKGGYDEALNKGFSIIANYIFGGNAKKEAIAMTAPVLEQQEKKDEVPFEKIAMTAPVLASIEGETHTIAFVMPSAYELEELPTPNDPRVKLRVNPPKKYAVLRFSGYYWGSRVNKMKERLLAALEKDKVSLVSRTPLFAGYNAPWTPPWMMRNEVLVEVK